MSVERLAAYLPVDRRRAIATGADLADRTKGSVLLADISGFTPLTEALVASLGRRRGADELTKLLNTVYTALVSRVHHFGGSVICFIGDALISCFPDDSGLGALSCGLQMQRTMRQFQAFPAPHGGRVSLAMKAAVAAGPMRRFLIGDPAIQRVDVLAGATIDRLTEAEHLAERGEVIASPEVARKLFGKVLLSEWRGAHGVVEGLRENVVPTPWPDLAYAGLTAQALEPYVLSPVHERVTAGQGEFLAELRPVSVLFLQFGGIDYEDDDAAGEKLDAYTRWVQGVAGRYGGHVLLLTTADKGSHLYVVFGALEAHEDDRLRVVAAALRLQEPPPGLDFITGVRIGVSHGRARVGAYGGESRRTYGALGDAVNLAARLMQAAPCGEIRCSESIYEVAKDRWSFDVLPAVELKGMERPQPVYRPCGREQSRAARDRSPLIGRRAELEIVRRSLQDARSGTRRGLLMEGEAGIGKTRLVEEIRRIAGEVGFTCLFGAADSIEQHTAYRAWRGVVLDLLEIKDVGDVAGLRARVVERVAALDPAHEARAPLLNDILTLGIPESPLTRSYDAAVRQNSLAAWIAELMRQAASSGPLALIIEDAHWLDSLSWELLVSVARALADRSALIVLTHRPFPEPMPTEFGTVHGMSGVETMLLGSLSPEDTLELTAVRLGLPANALPEAAIELLADRAEGNPFYATELIGALLDQGLLAMDGASCRVTVDADALRKGVPDTLEGVVLARLDQLPAEEQLTVKVASVIGRSFRLRTLEAIHPGRLERAELRKHLARTAGRRLTALETEDPEPVFAFQHAVTQQVAYDTLLHAQRRDLHRGVAGWYEDAHAEQLAPHYPLLVFHWNRAEHGEKECEYCLLAGAQAADRYALTEAEMYYTRALELIDKLDGRGESQRRFEAVQRRARVFGLLGRVDEERGDLERLLAWCEASGRATCRGEILLLWSDHHKRCGSFEEAKEQAERALSAMQEAAVPCGEADALTHIGNALEGLGQFQDARETVERALESFRAAGSLAGQAVSLKTLGIISARLGELPMAMERFTAARELYLQLGDRKGEADILGNLGALHYYLGDYEACIEFTEQAQPLFQEMGNRIGSAKCLTNLGNSYSALGAFADGLRSHEKALESYRQLEDESGCADSLRNMGSAHESIGAGGMPGLTFCANPSSEHLHMAFECSAEALTISESIGSGRGVMLSHYNLGTASLCLGDTALAESHLQIALDQSRDMDLTASVRWALSSLARVRFAAGDLESADVLSAEALEMLGDEAPPEAAEFHFVRFRILEARGQLAEAAPHLRAAHASLIEQSEGIHDQAVRERFLGTYGELLLAWEKHKAALHD